MIVAAGLLPVLPYPGTIDAKGTEHAVRFQGRYVEKHQHPDDWSHEHIQLLPLNRDYDPIIVTPHEAPEMVVVGEWVATID